MGAPNISIMFAPVTPSPVLNVQRIDAHLLVAPVAAPVRNSFRVLTERNALLVQVTDADGTSGWGEIWCNYPPGAARHRMTLLQQVVAPMLTGKSFTDPAAAYRLLEQSLRIPALQCGEPGSFAQVAAGVDVALWDLAARKLGQPLWQWLGGSPVLQVYASGLGPEQPQNIAAKKIEEGYRAVKLKVGFGRDVDVANVRKLRTVVGANGAVMLDANQRWNVGDAVAAAGAFADQHPLWLEEPIAADEPVEQWRALARQTPVALAAGENLRGAANFSALISSGAVRAIQPDIGKWGGFTGCLEVARCATDAGVLFCPHWLGGGVGLLASLHLLGAAGAAGWGEIDANANGLREDFLFSGFDVVEGRLTLNDAPGLGFAPDDDLLERYRAK